MLNIIYHLKATLEIDLIFSRDDAYLIVTAN